MKNFRKILVIMLILALCPQMLVACGKDDTVADDLEYEDEYLEDDDYQDDDYYYDDDEETDGDDGSDTETGDPTLSEDTMEKALFGEGTVTAFIDHPFYDGTINSDEDVLEAVYSVVDQIGGDDSTEFVIEAIDETEDGISFYTLRQVVGGLSVYGASAKLITDKNKKAVGLVSAVIPGLEQPPGNIWTVDANVAAEVVKKEYEGYDIRIYPEASEQTLLPIEDGDERCMYAWVIYSDNVFNEVASENKVDAAFCANYVSYDGDFLYTIPVTDVGNEEALSGSVAAFAFADMKSGTWTGTVTPQKGKKKTIEIPIMIDKNTGQQYLGDVKRKILCAMQPDFNYKDTLTPCESDDGEWDDEFIITYFNFLKIYDLYETTGWTGPDGAGTPTLLLMGATDEDGAPLQNACYSGKKQGFQVFEFDTQAPYGECTDIVGHEFTHCFTGKLMTANLYLNDYGAINEAMSDILGNLAAMMTDEEDVPFIIGEKETEGGMRSMKAPNDKSQPGFVWDCFYVPDVAEGNDFNDNGGVHTNSSLLNYISYKLNCAGIAPEDEFYYWSNVARTITPRTDYEQIAEILPWVMKTFGEDDYAAAVKNAVDETKISDNSIPDTPANGLAFLTVDVPENGYLEDKTVAAMFDDAYTGTRYESWAKVGTNRIVAAVPKGFYVPNIIIYDPESKSADFLVYYDGQWTAMNEEEYNGFAYYDLDDRKMVNAKAGDVVKLDSFAGVFE